MEMKPFTAGLSVSGQILASDLPAISDAGFKSILGNRPDGEGRDQPTFEEIATAAKQLGLKTAAAARIQAPIVAENRLADMAGKSPVAHYNGYGSCPLAVERGKIVLAEFGYGGAMLPSFPKVLIDRTKPSRAAWFLKEKMLPPIYWKGMLKGREWMAKPEEISVQ